MGADILLTNASSGIQVLWPKERRASRIKYIQFFPLVFEIKVWTMDLKAILALIQRIFAQFSTFSSPTVESGKGVQIVKTSNTWKSSISFKLSWFYCYFHCFLPDCGLGLSDRIVGGQEAEAHSIPWQVSLARYLDPNHTRESRMASIFLIYMALRSPVP